MPNNNAALMIEQQAQISELQEDQQPKFHDKKEATVMRPTLIIGNSVIKDINPKGLEDTDQKSKLTKPEEYEAIIIHDNTNDCT